MNLQELLLDYIRKYPGASYVNLQRAAAKTGFPVRGDTAIVREDYPTIIAWAGMSDEFAGAVLSLLHDGLVQERPTSLLVCLIDGGTLNLRLAKRLRAYKTPRWCPVVFDPAKPPGTTDANLRGRTP